METLVEKCDRNFPFEWVIRFTLEWEEMQKLFANIEWVKEK